MKEKIAENKKGRRFKHVIPLNLPLEPSKAGKEFTPLSACDCDKYCNVDICGVEEVEVCGIYSG